MIFIYAMTNSGTNEIHLTLRVGAPPLPPPGTTRVLQITDLGYEFWRSLLDLVDTKYTLTILRILLFYHTLHAMESK